MKSSNSLYNKLLSRKFWITVWALFMISYIVATDKVEFLTLADLLATIPLAYSGINYLSKRKHDGEQTLNENQSR